MTDHAAPSAPLPPPSDDTAERLARLRLIRSPKVGPVTYRRLIAEYGSGADALAALPQIAAKAGVSGYAVYSKSAAQAEIRAAQSCAARALFLGEAAYPATLAALSDAPPFLWAIGDLDLLTRPMVGMVGTRNASALGLRMARAVARDLGQAGIVTASGLARGIDTAVHHASLSTGTVAVMAGGVDVIYPPENAELAAQIGLRLSEMPMGRAPQARHFPRRNRIISGLSRGIVVIEAALRSGSMITARIAAEQGREVMAVPGHPLDTRASGCNLLLREGAHLIREARDVLVALDLEGAFARAPASAEPPDPAAARDITHHDSPHAMILSLIGAGAVSEDHLARVSALSSADLARHLTELELTGEITRSAGGMVARSDHSAAEPAAQRHQTAA